MIRETVLHVFPSDDQDHRLVVAVEQAEDGTSRLVLNQETRAEKVGWFVQSRVAILPEQIAGLKMALAGGQTAAIRPRRRSGAAPAVISFSAAASRVG